MEVKIPTAEEEAEFQDFKQQLLRQAQAFQEEQDAWRAQQPEPTAMEKERAVELRKREMAWLAEQAREQAESFRRP
jgi:hypothetical protein